MYAPIAVLTFCGDEFSIPFGVPAHCAMRAVLDTCSALSAPVFMCMDVKCDKLPGKFVGGVDNTAEPETRHISFSRIGNLFEE